MKEQILDLLSWAKSKGTAVSPLIHFEEINPNNVGARCNENVATSELQQSSLIKLPVKLAITPDTALNSFNESADCSSVQEKTKTNALLKLYLARERISIRIDESFFGDYLRLLPKLREIDSPYCWDSKLKSQLKGTNLGTSLKDNIGNLVNEWWEVLNALPQGISLPDAHYINMKFFYEFKFYTDDDLYNYFIIDENVDNWTSFPNFLWSSLILKSRSFPFYLLKEFKKSDVYTLKEDAAMLLPVIDLLNHDFKAKVSWTVGKEGEEIFFNFASESARSGEQLCNNYGPKGNEELLLSYGFCIEDNPADSAVLRVKVPLEMLPEMEERGVKLPTMDDYTTSVISNEENSDTGGSSKYEKYSEGLVFLVTREFIPDDLLKLFQLLIRNRWESGFSLRMRLDGINHLRKAIEAKKEMLSQITSSDSNTEALRNINIYVQSQKKIFSLVISRLKHLEKSLLTAPENRPRLLSLKTVYKKDKKFQLSLLAGLGITSFDSIIEGQFQDQCWLLYLIRCYNRYEYVGEHDDDDDDENFLPLWIYNAFKKLKSETEVSAIEVVSYKEIYQGLIIPLAERVPEIYAKGDWTVNNLVVSAKLLDTIGFVRGKEQECILVEPSTS
ncbi:uncharacterized protein PRCAT00004450001 [Priceomyces carsonii]|uniref:uncharacterized protein n=1 Tax=Priceomyces carsonii TaxID=28549 RepID=UPI002ED9EC46|nr:unnamed protein product [Priceomyces carsonii]